MQKPLEIIQTASEAINQAPSVAVKASAGSVGTGSVTTIVSSGVGWASYVGWSLTLLGALAALISAWIGYLTLLEKRRENDISEREIKLKEDKFYGSDDNARAG